MVLAKLNLLHLLEELFGRVHITRSVYEEVVVKGMRQGYEDAKTLHLFLDQLGWEPKDVDPERALEHVGEALLDQGERDTLVLAASQGNALVLMDEAAGRKAARRQGLTVRGSLWILVESYRRKRISAAQLRLYLAEIARREDIWISRGLVTRVLQELWE
jgi:predicted nucleic acid-binding protein